MVDLYPKANVFYTVQRVNIGNLTVRSVSHTNSFNAPWTENNEQLFGFARKEQTASPIIYQLRPCKIVNGFEVGRDLVLYITKSNERDFSLQVFENIFDWFMAVNNKNIADVEPIDPSGWEASDIDDARDTAGGIISAAIDWTTTSSFYQALRFMPSFYYHTFITKILEFTGLEIEGEILTDPRFTDLIIPFAKDEFRYPESYYRQFNFYNPHSSDYPVVGSTSEITFIGYNPSEYLHGTLFARVSIGGIAFTGGNDLYLFLRKNGDLLLSYHMASSPAPGTSVEVEWTGYVEPGDSFNFSIFADATGAGIDYTIVSGAGASTYMKFTPDGIINRGLVNWNALLPEISCTDLLKDFFTRFAIIPKQVNDTLILKTIDEIVEDVSGAVDWSAKLVNVHKKGIDFKTDYAQENKFLYNDIVEDPGLGAGSIDINNNTLPLKKTTYKSIFGNSNTIQHLGWNVAIVPVFDGSTPEIEGFSEGREVLGADAIEQDDDGKIVELNGTFNFTIDLLTTDTEVMLKNTGAGVVTLTEGTGITLPGGSFAIDPDYYVLIVFRKPATPDIYYHPFVEEAVFADPPGLRLLTLKEVTTENAITFDATPRSDYKMGYFVDETLDKDTGFQYFIDQFYPSIEAALQLNKNVTKYYRLSDADVHDYDVHKMMYDGEGYYLVNKISNYAAGKITKVDLFKLM